MAKIKILFVGSVGKNLSVLHKKLKALNSSKAGPFHVCFCVGPINIRAEDVTENKDGGFDSFSLPVYLQDAIIDSSIEESILSSSCSSQGIVSLRQNLYHLKGDDSNQLQMFEIKVDNNAADSLLVAACPRFIRSKSATESEGQQSKQKQCDILLSCCWPQGMEDVLNVDTEPLSYDVAEVALECRPRYHVCPSTMLYHASPPYTLPNTDHVGRFLALAPVTTQKKTPKTSKFIHAIGLIPLNSNPEPTIASSTLPCPFSGGIGTNSTGSSSRSNNNTSFSVQKFENVGYSRFANSNKRGRDDKFNGGNNRNNNNSLESPGDPTISTLFLYGLHKDVTGQLQNTRSPKVLLSFRKYGVTRVRHPSNVQSSTYCFLEFLSQKDAANCLQDCHGQITIDSVNLTLKWASASKNQHPQQHDNKRQRRDEYRPHPHQQHFVTESAAKDSTTLFFHPPKTINQVRKKDCSECTTEKRQNDANEHSTIDTKAKSSEMSKTETTVASTNETDIKITDKTNLEKSSEKEDTEVIDMGTSDKASNAEDTDVINTSNKVDDETEDTEVAGKVTSDEKNIADVTSTNNKMGDESMNNALTGERTLDKESDAKNTGVTNNADSTLDKDENKEIIEKNKLATENMSNVNDFACSLQQYLQQVLESAINEGVDDKDRVTAETEPALKVGVRCKEQYGFLEFASHAAATMALAAVTNSTDGGLLIDKPEGVPPENLVGCQIRWARGTSHTKPLNKKGDRNERLKALGLKQQYYPADGRTDCWFCLSSPTCETGLITGVYDDWYATMPKGPVHQGHVLLVPVKHTKQGAWTLNDEWVKLVDKVQEHASKVYNMDLFVFERSMETRGGYHTHVQCVPVPRDSSTRLETVMVAHAKSCGFDFRRIESDLGMGAIIQKNDSYFYAEIRTRTNQQKFLYRCEAGDENASRVPLQFAREVLASVLNNPKLAHWKACVVDHEQETQLASDLRNSFLSFESATSNE